MNAVCPGPALAALPFCATFPYSQSRRCTFVQARPARGNPLDSRAMLPPHLLRSLRRCLIRPPPRTGGGRRLGIF